MSTAPKSPTGQPKSLEELAAEQGVQLPQDIDQIIGKGADLFDSDADFEQWMEWLREIRREGR